MTEETLNDDDEAFLLSIVEDVDSDYHDGLDGYPNYSIEDDVLTVTFQSAEDAAPRTTTTGKWRLEFIEGSEVSA